MTRRKTSPNGRVMVGIAIDLIGSVPKLAAAIRADETTVRRWRSGKVKLAGTALTAVLAVIKHPAEYRVEATK